MAKNTGIERSKKNPIELRKGGFLHIWPFSLFPGSFITCIEHHYAVVHNMSFLEINTVS
jgi:hypothetical protein